MNDPEIRTTPHGRPPGYPWFLAAVYRVCGLSYLAPRVVQMGLGLVNVLLAFALGRRLFGNAAGLLGAAFAATYWAFPYWESQLACPVVVIFLLLCFLLALHAWLGAPGMWYAFLAGLLLGLFALFQPNGLLVWPLYLAWFAWVLRRAGAARRWWRVAAAFSLGIVLPMLPPMARNWAVARDFVFLSSRSGLNLYADNHTGASGVEQRIPELEELAGIENWSCFDYPAIVRGLGEKLERPGLKFSEASTYFSRRTTRMPTTTRAACTSHSGSPARPPGATAMRCGPNRVSPEPGTTWATRCWCSATMRTRRRPCTRP